MVDYKFLLLNLQKEKKTYLVVEDVNKEKYCFYRTIVGGLARFDRFVPLEDFSDTSNDYLTNNIYMSIWISRDRCI